MRRVVVCCFLSLVTFFSLSGGSLSAETPARAPIEKPKPFVLASIPPQAQFLKRLTGDAVDVEVIIPVTSDHNLYEPSVAQLKRFTNADGYFTIGHPDFVFERTWADRIASMRSEFPIFNTFRKANLRPGDPHLWVSTKEIVPMLHVMAEDLSALYPALRTDIERNRAELVEEVSRVAEDVKRELSLMRSIPTDGRPHFITAHPYWGYLADECGLVQLAIEEEGKEPTPARIAEIIEIGRRRSIRAVLVQPQYSSQAARRIAREIGAEVIEIDPFAFDWFATMRHLVEVFKKALA